jgi:hypothetical protein
MAVVFGGVSWAVCRRLAGSDGVQMASMFGGFK